MAVNHRVTAWVVAMAAGALLVIGLAQAAVAVSGGGYTPGQQDCPANADANNAGEPGAQQPENPVAGCHAAKINIEDGHGNRYAEVGVDQLPNGYPSTPGLTGVGYPQSPNFPHSGCVAVNTAGTGNACGDNPSGLGGALAFDTYGIATCTYDNVWLPNPNHFEPPPTTPPSASCTPGDPNQTLKLTPDTGTGVDVGDGITFYMGADDNLDAGEHDGASGDHGTHEAVNGPSDGGAINAHVTPSAATTMPTPENPLPFLGLAEGECADGFCVDITTYQQTLYEGGSEGSRDIADYSGKTWDPYDCSSGDIETESPEDCDGKSLNEWRHQEKQQVNAEPGVQVYEDPDAQASPIDPLYEAGLTPTPTLYPIPGVYVGTCGVIAGGGPGASAPASPVTNSANQIDVRPTGC
jgi:hypothetical protein